MAVKIKFNKREYENGVDLSIHIDFIPAENNTMEVLQFTISRGYNSVDFAEALKETRLYDILKEFVRQE